MLNFWSKVYVEVDRYGIEHSRQTRCWCFCLLLCVCVLATYM